jgi:hypothetical protein
MAPPCPHEDQLAGWLEQVGGIGCSMQGSRCPREVAGFVVSLVPPEDGIHAVAPVDVWPACARHRRAVTGHATRSASGPLRPGWSTDLTTIWRWFHGESGLCAGRGLCVTLPPPSAG